MNDPFLSSDSASLWVLILAVAGGVFAIRLSFVQFHEVVEGFPPRVRRSLTFVPAAVLAALVTPALFPLGGPVVETVVNARAIAGVVAVVVAWRTRSMTATIVSGMVVFHAVQYVL